MAAARLAGSYKIQRESTVDLPSRQIDSTIDRQTKNNSSFEDQNQQFTRLNAQ